MAAARRFGLVGPGAAALGVLLLGPLPAAAAVRAAAPAPALTTADACDRVVVDGAHVLGAGPAVPAAAAVLTADGARVRVRTYRTVPDGDLDAYLRSQVRRCPSWHAAGGGRRADLLVLAVSVDDRRTALSYGRRWAPLLDHDERSVQTDDVNPQLARKAYAAAVAAGLRRLHELVAGDMSDDTAVDTAVDTSVDTSGDTALPPGVSEPVVDPSGSGGFPGGGMAVLGVVAVAGVAAVLGLGGRGARRSRWTSSGTGTTGHPSTSSAGFSSGFSGSSSGSDGGGSSSGSDGGGGSSTSW